MSGAPSPADRPADDRIRALLDSAMAAHRSGDNDGAEAGYRTVLALAPEHPEALHLLGVCRHQARDTSA
jgi:Flp pilus assembly protein TadD